MCYLSDYLLETKITSAPESDIDQLVYPFYGLTEDVIKIVENR